MVALSGFELRQRGVAERQQMDMGVLLSHLTAGQKYLSRNRCVENMHNVSVSLTVLSYLLKWLTEHTDEMNEIHTYFMTEK